MYKRGTTARLGRLRRRRRPRTTARCRYREARRNNSVVRGAKHATGPDTQRKAGGLGRADRVRTSFVSRSVELSAEVRGARRAAATTSRRKRAKSSEVGRASTRLSLSLPLPLSLSAYLSADYFSRLPPFASDYIDAASATADRQLHEVEFIFCEIVGSLPRTSSRYGKESYFRTLSSFKYVCIHNELFRTKGQSRYLGRLLEKIKIGLVQDRVAFKIARNNTFFESFRVKIFYVMYTHKCMYMMFIFVTVDARCSSIKSIAIII